MTISQALKELYSSGGESVILETLELNHHTFPDTFRIVRDNVNWDLGLEDSGPVVTFTAYPFNAIEPKSNETGTATLQIVIDNVDRSLLALIEGTQDGTATPIDIIYRIYISTDTSGPQITPIKLSLFNISVTNTQISGTAKRDDIVNRKFPNDIYDERFQNLYLQS